MREYSAHLAKQYCDRVVYWSSRLASRLPMVPDGPAAATACIRMDAVDHSKLQYPKHPALQAKEFAGLLRPSMDCHAAICHGRGLVLALSEPFLRKDSSWCVEILAHCIHMISRTQDVRGLEVILQADNTARECKNNCMLRFAALLVSLHQVKRVELRFLTSGHSHEDVDMFFAQMINFIERSKDVQTPADYKSLLDKFLLEGGVRPDERGFREVAMVSSVRDWTHGLW